MFKYPGEQGSGRRLPVSAADHQRAFAANEEFLEQFRQGTIPEFVVQHILSFRITPGNRISNNDQVGLIGQVVLRVTRNNLNFPIRQES